MRVFRPCINLEVAKKRISEARLGQHSLHGVLQKEFVFPLEGVRRVGETLSSGIAGVSYVDLVGHLLARQPYLVGVHDDNVVAAIDVRGKTGLVFAAQYLRDLLGKASQNLPLGVDDEPFLVDRLCVSGDCFVTL